MGRLRTINVDLNRRYRNDLNWNFQQIETDIDNVTDKQNADGQFTKTELLRIDNESKERDNFLAGVNVEEYIESINIIKQNAVDATLSANIATQNAINATDEAILATENANQSATLAQNKADYADEKAILADEAAELANMEASNLSQLKIDVVSATQSANSASLEASTNAQYALEMGIYAKSQGDWVAENLDNLGGGIHVGSSSPPTSNMLWIDTN